MYRYGRDLITQNGNKLMMVVMPVPVVYKVQFPKMVADDGCAMKWACLTLNAKHEWTGHARQC